MTKQPAAEGKTVGEKPLPSGFPALSSDSFQGEAGLQRMLHELQMHQIELENQNEELRRSQHELELSQARYFELYDLAPVSYLTLTGQGLILEGNLAAASLLGVERRDLVRQPLARYIHPDDLDLFSLHRVQLLATGKPQGCELRLLNASGGQFRVKVDAIASQDKESGEPVCRVVMSDITERRVTEKSLRTSDERLSLALEASKMGVWEWDLQSNAVHWSPECHDIVGLKEFDGAFDTFAGLLHPGDAAHVMDTVDRALTRGGAYTDEFRIVRPDGELRWLSNLGRVTYDGNGIPLRLTGTVQDITERKHAEEKLEEANRFSEQVIRSAQEGVIVFDQELRYRVWNPFMEEMTGMMAGEVLGRHPAELFPFLQELGLIERLERVLSGEKFDFTDYQYVVTKTGKSGWTSSASAPLRNTKGDIVGALSTVREITGRKKMEDELRQALETAEAVNVTMNRLLRVIAHEFRSPLGVLTGSTEILDHYRDRLTPEKILELHENIRNASSKLTDLIHSVVSFNRRGTERTLGTPRMLDIGEVCSAITAGVETVWGAGQNCTVTTSPGCATALLDETLFRRVVENLLTNAFRYTPADGTVSFLVNREEKRLSLEINDTGIGIPDEDQELIFDAFYRSRNVEWRGGLGLGLSIVRESLSQMGGTITVNSKIGAGTKMRVEIPIADPV